MFIGITGKAGAGKDTVASIMKRDWGHNFPNGTYAFASPIKKLAERWIGLTDAYLHRDLKESNIPIDLDDDGFRCLDIYIHDMFKEFGVSPIQAKKCATAIIDNLAGDGVYGNSDENKHYLITSPRRVLQVIGTEGFRNTIRDDFWCSIAPTENVIITDVRFDNEAKWIKDNGGKILQVVRGNEFDEIKENAHSSESGININLIDRVVDNTGSMQDLEVEVDSTISSILCGDI